MEKFTANVERDERNSRELRILGWRVATIWECETRDTARLKQKIDEILRTCDTGV